MGTTLKLIYLDCKEFATADKARVARAIFLNSGEAEKKVERLLKHAATESLRNRYENLNYELFWLSNAALFYKRHEKHKLEILLDEGI